MSISRKLKNASSGAADGGGGPGTYVDDVFSTYVYEGTGTFLTITNGIDLDGKGGMTWFKRRDGDSDHQVFDSERTGRYALQTNTSDAQRDEGGVVWAPKDTGFRINGDAGSKTFNSSGDDYVSWTWRKAPKFFDVVTYTGDGTAGRAISHNLDCEVGTIFVKDLNNTSNWYVYHRGLTSANYGLQLNKTDPGVFYGTGNVTNTTFSFDHQNSPGFTYVAYLFAHDDSDESLIKCGSYTGNGNLDGPEIDLGFEPQFVLVKRSDDAGDWFIQDSMRSLNATTTDMLFPNLPNSATTGTYASVVPTSTGFCIRDNGTNYNFRDGEYIYMAIRRPNKPAEEFDPEELFAVDNRDTAFVDPAMISGFPVDMAIHKDTSGGNNSVSSRMTGPKRMFSDTSAAETGPINELAWDYMEGYRNGASANASEYSWMWRRAPGYFDVVCYEGDGQIGHDVPHNLGVAPEMIWVKSRNNTTNWAVYHKESPASSKGGTASLRLHVDAAADTSSSFWPTQHTEADFNLGDRDESINAAAYTYIAYLFATVPGISKVGSYTGNGGNQTIDCGFTNGARFVVVKKTNSTDGANGSSGGDWMFWDTVRGLTNADNDPWLSLNTNAAQGRVSGRDIDPHPSGFSVNTDYPYINDVGGEYIFYAIA